MRQVGDILKNYFSDKELKRGNQYHRLFNSWEDIVGSQLAAHTGIQDITNGSLLIEVDHPGWMQRMQMKERLLLKRIQERFPELEISSISLRLNDQQYRGTNQGSAQKKASNQEEGYEEFKTLFETFKKTVLDREKGPES